MNRHGLHFGDEVAVVGPVPGARVIHSASITIHREVPSAGNA